MNGAARASASPFGTRSSAFRARIAFLGIALVAASCASSDEDYVRVVVNGAAPELGTAPLTFNVAIYGGGKAKTFAIPHALSLPADFTVLPQAGAGTTLDLRVTTLPNDVVPWGGDARVTLPGHGRDISISMARGEARVDDATLLPARLDDGDVVTGAQYGGSGLVVAWLTSAGLAYRPLPNPDTALAKPSPIPDARPSKLRVASRPSAGFGSDIFALAWLGHEPSGSVVRRVAVGDRSRAGVTRVTVPDPPDAAAHPWKDVRVACAKKSTTTADVISVALRDDGVWGAIHGADGGVRMVGGAPSAFPIPLAVTPKVLTGVLSTPGDTFVVATRDQDGKSRVTQVSNVGAHEVVRSVELEGDVNDIALTLDTTRILVAATLDGTLRIASLAAGTLEREGAPAPIAPYPFFYGDSAARVSVSGCMLAWPEKRADGSGHADIRYTFLDPEGAPTGDPHVANVETDSDHVAPTSLCVSSTRVFMTFVQGDASSAGLFLRAIPTPLATP